MLARCGRCAFPENREINREFLQTSPDSGLFERFLTPLAEWIQWLAADSLFHLKTGNFSVRTGNSSSEQGIFRRGFEVAFLHGGAAHRRRKSAGAGCGAAYVCSLQ